MNERTSPPLSTTFGPSPAMKWTALSVATFSSFLTAFMAAAVNVALPTLQEEFRLSAVLQTWVPTSLLLAAAMFVVPFGRLADIYGRKKVFNYGITIFTIFTLLCGFAWSGATLLVFRFVQGIGAALIYATGIAILTSVFLPQDRGKALGITVAAVYVGLSSGPAIGGLLTTYVGWRSIFFIPVPLSMAILVSTKIWLKQEWAEGRGESFDYSGSFIYALSLFSLMYGFSILPRSLGFAFLGAGILMIILFVLWESRIAKPILNIALIKTNRVFALSNLAALIHYSATSAVTFLMSLYLQHVKGMSPHMAGFVLIWQPIVQAFLAPFTGWLSDKVEPRIVATIGMAMTAASLVLLSFIHAETTISHIVGNLVLLGFGFALFSSPNVNAVMGSVDKHQYSVGSAILASSRIIGQVFSMGFTVLVFSVFLGKAEINPSNYPAFLKSMKVLFILFAIFCVGSVAASLARGNVRKS